MNESESAAEAFLKRSDIDAWTSADSLRSEGAALLESCTGDELAMVEIGLARVDRMSGALASAIDLLRSAFEHADSADLRSEAQLRIVPALGAAGLTEEALDVASSARADAPTHKLPRVLSQVGSLHAHTGELDEAVALFDEALELAMAIDDDEAVAVILNNRASAFSDGGQFTQAEIDIRRVLALDDAPGLRSHVLAKHNLGLMLGRQGQIRSALVMFDEASAAGHGLGLHNGDADHDRAEMLLNARVLAEASAIAWAALMAAEDGGSVVMVPRFHLQLARIALAEGTASTAAAVDHLELAANKFDGQERPDEGDRVRRIASLLDLTEPARLDDLDVDDALTAEALLHRTKLAADAATNRDANHDEAKSGPAAAIPTILRAIADATPAVNPVGRVLQLYAEAAAFALEGHRAKAGDALDRCFDRLENYAGGLESLELRARALELIAPVESLAIELAQAGDAPADFIHWTDRARRVVLGGPMMSIPSPDLIAQLERLRGNLVESRKRHDRPEELEVQREDIEARIRFLSRTAERAEGAIANPRDLADLTHPGMLVYGQRADRVIGMCVGPAASLVDLCSVTELDRGLQKLRFLATIAARETPAPTERDFAALARQAKTIDDLLVSPLLGDMRPEQVSVVPTGAVHAVPWRLLPSLDGIPTKLVSGRYPTANRAEKRRVFDRLVAVSGPGLSEETEVDDISAMYDSTTSFESSGATCQNVLDALDSADVLHVAAHGSIRSDDPLLSNLDLSDGPLTAYDIETATHVPETVVLACCRVGGSTSNHTAAYGIATVLAAKGARQIVASSVDLSDRHARVVMPALHRLLREGHDAETALASLRFDTPEVELAAKSLMAIRSI